MATGMLVSDVITRVLRIFGDDAQVQITQADIIRWINDAQRELALSNNLLRVVGSLTTVPGQSQYTLPTNPAVLTLSQIKYNGITLRQIEQQEADRFIANNDDPTNYPTGTPTHFWLWGPVFTLYPAPATSSANDLKLYYTRQPNDVANPTDSLDLPAQYHNLIVSYCHTQAYQLDDNMYSYQVKNTEYKEKVQQMKDNQEWEVRDAYPHISVVGADAGDYFEGYGAVY